MRERERERERDDSEATLRANELLCEVQMRQYISWLIKKRKLKKI